MGNAVLCAHKLKVKHALLKYKLYPGGNCGRINECAEQLYVIVTVIITEVKSRAITNNYFHY